ncbi:MAG: hypothetical protein SWO11_02665 [Thermodesulfobacteriota bacterium]|nr:hypothetical protein [Thermodesulfobacteriota bacterium]
MADDAQTKKMKHIFVATIFFILLLFFSGQQANATSGSVISGGAVSNGVAEETGFRECVELNGSDGLLYGRPNHKSVQMITAYAPGIDKGHLTLRELATKDAGYLLLLSAPDSLQESVGRVTIYLKHHNQHLALYEYEEEEWHYRRPYLIQQVAEGVDGIGPQNIMAFTMKGLGLFWLAEKNFSELSISTEVPHAISASLLLGGGIFRGILPWIWAFLLLFLARTISRRIYKSESSTWE